MTIKYDGLHPRYGSSDCFTSALAISQFSSFSWNSLSRPSGSRRVWVEVWVAKLGRRLPIWSKIPWNTGTTCSHVWMNPALNRLDHMRSILQICETLAGKRLANQRSTRQICQYFHCQRFVLYGNIWET